MRKLRAYAQKLRRAPYRTHQSKTRGLGRVRILTRKDARNSLHTRGRTELVRTLLSRIRTQDEQKSRKRRMRTMRRFWVPNAPDCRNQSWRRRWRVCTQLQLRRVKSCGFQTGSWIRTMMTTRIRRTMTTRIRTRTRMTQTRRRMRYPPLRRLNYERSLSCSLMLAGRSRGYTPGNLLWSRCYRPLVPRSCSDVGAMSRAKMRELPRNTQMPACRSTKDRSQFQSGNQRWTRRQVSAGRRIRIQQNG